jgi:hypothetical protein
MKTFRYTFIILIVFLAACNSERRTEVPTDATTPGLTITITKPSTITFTPTLTVALSAATLTPTLTPNMAKLLISSMKLQSLEETNAHPLQRITGWANGWRGDCGSYNWMDDGHLLLYPVTGEYENFGTYQQSLPVVASLESGRIWLPVTSGPTDACNRAIWSEQFGKLIALQEKETQQLDLEGNVIQRFPGGDATGILSPSGQRLVTGNILINLETNEVQTGVSVPGDWFGAPAWSSDETRIFRCCFGYANFKANKYTRFKLDIEQGAREVVGGGIPSQWINDSRVMVLYDFYGPSGFVWGPLIDPESQSYVNVWVPGLSWGDARYSSDPSFSPNGQFMAVPCRDEIYWIDLQTLVTHTVPGEFHFVNWSPDSQFFLLAHGYDPDTTRGEYFLQPVKGEDFTSLSNDPIVAPAWKGTNLFFLDDQQRMLISLEPTTNTARRISLPKAVMPKMFWCPRNECITFVSQDSRALILVEMETYIPTLVSLTQPISPIAYRSPQDQYSVSPEVPYLIFPGSDKRSWSVFNVRDRAINFVPLEQPIGGTVLWQSEGLLSWLTEDNNTLLTLDITTGEIRQVSFRQSVMQLIQKPQDKGLVALVADGSLWWVPDLESDRVEQLTPHLPDIRDARWSPSGNRLAFISGSDVYVVTVTLPFP